jgi:hypothetical protein
MSTTSVPNQVRLFLSTNPGFHSTADIATGLGLETKQVSGAVSKLVKAERIVREDGKVADPQNTEAPKGGNTPADPEPSEEPVEDLAEEVGETTSEEPEALFYECIDFPGNYSIVMAPFALEIAEAAGVPAKVETFAGKLTRRVWFGGDDVDRAKRVLEIVKAESVEAMDYLHTWQKDNKERRKGLTDMQRYIEHREVLAEHGHKVARQVKKGLAD